MVLENHKDKYIKILSSKENILDLNNDIQNLKKSDALLTFDIKIYYLGSEQQKHVYKIYFTSETDIDAEKVIALLSK